MTDTQITELVTSVPIAELISLLTAISNRDFPQFQQLESRFANLYGVDVWEEYFNFRLIPSLDKTSSKWLLEQLLGLVAA